MRKPIWVPGQKVVNKEGVQRGQPSNSVKKEKEEKKEAQMEEIMIKKKMRKEAKKEEDKDPQKPEPKADENDNNYKRIK